MISPSAEIVRSSESVKRESPASAATSLTGAGCPGKGGKSALEVLIFLLIFFDSDESETVFLMGEAAHPSDEIDAEDPFLELASPADAEADAIPGSGVPGSGGGETEGAGEGAGEGMKVRLFKKSVRALQLLLLPSGSSPRVRNKKGRRAGRQAGLAHDPARRAMAAIPFLKVAVLLVKQLTKPLTRALKARAQSNERFGSVCGFFGQQWHVQTTRLNLYAQGHRVKGIKPLNEEEAQQSGAELLSEGFVLSVGLGALILETRRSARATAEKAAQKEARRQAKMADLEARFKFLQSEFEDVSQVTKALYHHVELLDRAAKNGPGWQPLPPLPQSLAKVADPIASQALTDHKKGLNEPEPSVLKQVTSTVSVQGLSHLIRYLGAAINGEEMELEDDDLAQEEQDIG